MPLFVMIAMDSQSGSRRRTEIRDAHLAHVEALAQDNRITFAGPLRDETTGQPIGSLIIFEAFNLEDARTIADRDPYTREQVFGAVQVYPVTQVLPRAV